MTPVRSLLALALIAATGGDSGRGPRPLSWLATRGIEAIDLDDVLAGVDVDALVQRVDVAALAARIDLNALLAGVDVDQVAQRIDLDALLAEMDVDRLVSRIDVDRLVSRVDVDRLVSRVDPDPLLDRVDVNRLLDRVDPDRLLDRVDADRLLDRVDVDRLADRIDVQRIADRMDVQGIVDRAGIADIVADSTGAMAGSLLDVVRRQLVALDTIVERVVYRLVRRDPDTRPAAPRTIALTPGRPAKDGRGQVTGHYAGPVSRAAAFVLDLLIVFWVFTAAAAALSWIAGKFGIDLPQDGWVFSTLFLLWGFGYWLISLALTARTVGKAVIGLKIVDRLGTPLTARQALVRTLLLPLSFLLLGVGVLVVLVSPRRISLHDAVARTCEVYDWGDRPAELPAPLTAWIDRRTSTPDLR